MSSIQLVIRYEIRTALSKRSFWLMTFIFPFVIIAASIVPQILAGDSFEQDPIAAAAATTSGYVDLSGIIEALPPDVSAQRFTAFTDQVQADAALAAGEIDQYFLIAADYLGSGAVTVISNEFNVFGGLSQAGSIEYVLDANLLDDAALAALISDPTPQMTRQALTPAPSRQNNSEFRFILPFAAMFILFFIISFSSGYMLQSVAREKENRTAEVLLLSLQPRSLMIGKLVGLGGVALLQMGVWLGGVLLVLGQGASAMPIPGGLSLPPDFFVLTILYLFLGYLAFASAMGALGALAPSAREGAQFTFIIILPLLLPFWLNSVFIANPDGGLALILSLIPLTAPTAMVARLAITTVPVWQLLVSLGGLIATTYFFVNASARFFRADTLLSSASLDWRRLLRELRGMAS